MGVPGPLTTRPPLKVQTNFCFLASKGAVVDAVRTSRLPGSGLIEEQLKLTVGGGSRKYTGGASSASSSNESWTAVNDSPSRGLLFFLASFKKAFRARSNFRRASANSR